MSNEQSEDLIRNELESVRTHAELLRRKSREQSEHAVHPPLPLRKAVAEPRLKGRYGPSGGTCVQQKRGGILHSGIASMQGHSHEPQSPRRERLPKAG